MSFEDSFEMNNVLLDFKFYYLESEKLNCYNNLEVSVNFLLQNGNIVNLKIRDNFTDCIMEV